MPIVILLYTFLVIPYTYFTIGSRVFIEGRSNISVLQNKMVRVKLLDGSVVGSHPPYPLDLPLYLYNTLNKPHT